MTSDSWAEVLKALGGSTVSDATPLLPSMPSTSGSSEAPPSSGEQLLEESRLPTSEAAAEAPLRAPPALPAHRPLPFGEGDCFLDLGSGRGCLVVQAALMCPGMR